jgi:arsenate reductase
MSIVIYHNSKCSKSRATLEILKEKETEFKVIKYLDNPPSQMEIKAILNELNLSARELMRTGEKEYKVQNLAEINEESLLIEAMVRTPILMQRPIVKTSKGVVIARPPERVLSIL